MADRTSSLRLSLLVCLVLAVLVSIVYWQTSGFDLVGLDDDSYITNNPYVLLGLRQDTAHWAFSTVDLGIWHPMVWLSYMADSDAGRALAMRHILLGPRSVGIYHLDNALQHLLSSLLLFFIFLRMTGSHWRSAFLAAVFAVHPLNVESVAWVAERKNTLSTLLCFVTLLAYLSYVRRPALARYMLMLVLFAIGLMAKAVLVTIPVMLLLMDYWPLGRFQDRSLWQLVREKLPMFGLAAASGVMAFFAQKKGGLIAPDDVFPPGVRIANSFVSLLKYVWLMILPRNLSVCYVHPGHGIPTWLVVFSAAAVVGITALVIRRRARVPYLFAGWIWYLVTILPVIGIVQVADQGLADRYIYIPMVGLLMMAAWGLPELFRTPASAYLRKALPAAACVVVVVFAFMSHKQTGYWRDSVTMYRQVIRVNPNSRTGYSGLGSALSLRGEHEEAQACLLKAMEIDPRDVTSRINLGIDLAMQRKMGEAMQYLEEALEMSPGDPRASYNLARILLVQGKLKEAKGFYQQAIDAMPSFVDAQIELGNTMLLLRQAGEAIAHYEKALQLRPDRAGTHVVLAGALEELGRIGEAIEHYREALRLDPNRWDAANNLAWILATQTDPRYSDRAEAVRLAESTARLLRNRNPQVMDTLAAAYAADGRYEDAAAATRRAITVARSTKQGPMVKDLSAKLQRYEALLSGRPL